MQQSRCWNMPARRGVPVKHCYNAGEGHDQRDRRRPKMTKALCRPPPLLSFILFLQIRLEEKMKLARPVLILALIALMLGCLPNDPSAIIGGDFIDEAKENEGEASGDSDSQDTGDTIQVTTKDGRCTITFFGPSEARRGDPFQVQFQVVCGGSPGQGTFFATLGVPPSDANATHANGELGIDGAITLTLDVNWETGVTTLLCSFEGEVYEVTQITILESG